VEVSSERSLLLPFDQFSFSELTGESNEQCLRFVFATHEVLIRGHALRRLETVMQRMELGFIARTPDASRSLAADGQPMILEIVAGEVDAADHSARVSPQ
jgi:hypothetical protein